MGSIGDIGCFSFFPSKNLGGFGDGGMVVTNSAEHDDRLRLLRAHGARAKYVTELVGMNSRLDALQAALLRVGLQHIQTSLGARQRQAAAYDDAFRDLPDVLVPPPRPGRTYHQYVITLPDRDQVKESLARLDVATAVHYPLPLHLHAALSYLGYQVGDLPLSEVASQRVLSLPIFPTMTDEELSAVIAAVLVALEAKDLDADTRRVRAR